MNIDRGFRCDLGRHVNVSKPFTVAMSVSGYDRGNYEFSCYALDANGINRKRLPDSTLSYYRSGNEAAFTVNLQELPHEISGLIFTVSIESDNTMSKISSHTMTLKQGSGTPLTLQLNGSDFSRERAIVSAEIYKKDSAWRFGAVASGFNGGIEELIECYDKRVNKKNPSSSSQPESSSVELNERQHSVNLKKPAGEILINFNWNKKTIKRTFFDWLFRRPLPEAIDLDLGCFYELHDGTKGYIQALGGQFGSLIRPPYIFLDGDDRTGELPEGENIKINGERIYMLKKIMVYTFIYKGIDNWRDADGVVTITCPGNKDVIVRMGEHNTIDRVCAIAALEKVDEDALLVERLVRFFPDHEQMDRYYHWGFSWVHGQKNQ